MANQCDDCGKKLRRGNAKRCWQCCNEHRLRNRPRCSSCGVDVRRGNKTCWDCYCEIRRAKKKSRMCSDCGRAKVQAKSSLCWKCYRTGLREQYRQECVYTLEEYNFLAEFGVPHTEVLRRLSRAMELSPRGIEERLSVARVDTPGERSDLIQSA